MLTSPLVVSGYSSSLCLDYEVVPASANLPLMKMNILLLTRNQLQEIIRLLLGPLPLSRYYFGNFSVTRLYYGVFSGGVNSFIEFIRSLSITRCQAIG